jgi:hypothetical protein
MTFLTFQSWPELVKAWKELFPKKNKGHIDMWKELQLNLY